MGEKRVTVKTLKEMKEKGEKIVMLTAYDFTTARLLDESGVDVILVGDSLSNVFQGNDTTLPVTVDEMLYHTKVVSRAVKRAMVVGDMPFLSYQVSEEQAVYNAGRFLKEAGAQAVKIEGGQEMTPLVKRLTGVGIPAMGHIGLTPQSVHQLGGYRLTGKLPEEAKKLVEDAVSLEKAGAFSIVLEMVPASLSKMITEKVSVPTIGIGAGIHCDGQVLVVNDMVGFTESNYRFVKRYAEVGKIIKDAVTQYADEVKKGKFPTEEHSF